MARVELFATVEKVITVTDATPSPIDILVPADGASVQVNVRGGSAAQIYSSETGGTTISNPLATNELGQINGWVEEGAYTLQVSGSGITSYNQPYDALRGDAALALSGARIVNDSIPTAAYTPGSIGTDALAAGSVTLDKLDPDIIPIGTIIEWWRPSSGQSLPTGWLPCDGSQVTAGNHNFTGGGTITLPDLRNVFVLGANAANPDAQAGSFSDAASAAPGIRGTGSSHSQSVAHSHTVNSHGHIVWNHGHGFPDHAHSFWVPDHYHNIPTSLIWIGGWFYSYPHSYTGGASWAGWAGSGGSGIGGTYGQGDFWSGNTAPGTSSALGTTDMRPQYIGLLYLIKVKNS